MPGGEEFKLFGLLEELWRRCWSCPRTTDAAAQDFLENQNPETVRRALAAPDTWYDFYWVDNQRRIAVTYGLARRFDVRPTGRWSPGWNRRLLAPAGPEPEEAARRIPLCVCELAKRRRAPSEEWHA